MDYIKLDRVKQWIRKDLLADRQPWSENKARSNNLDFMRFFFAVLVIFSHSFILNSGDNSREPIWLLTHGQITGGFLAVAFFFIVSGFLIAQSWMNSRGIINFFQKRILRIYPAFIVVSLFCVLVIAALGSPVPNQIIASFSPVRFAVNSVFLYLPSMDHTFVSNPVPFAVNGSAWTIKYEFWCYILIAFLGISLVMRRRSLVLALFGGILILYGLQTNGVIDLSTLPDNGKIGLIFGSWLYYPEFISLFLGGAVFYLFRDKIPFSNIIFITSLVAILLLSAFSEWLNLFIPVLGAYILFYIGFHPSIKMQTFTRRGDFSYGLYLWAYPIQQLLVFYSKASLPPLLLFLIAFILTLILAFLSWNLIEKPALKLKDKFPFQGRLLPTKAPKPLV